VKWANEGGPFGFFTGRHVTAKQLDFVIFSRISKREIVPITIALTVSLAEDTYGPSSPVSLIFHLNESRTFLMSSHPRLAFRNLSLSARAVVKEQNKQKKITTQCHGLATTAVVSTSSSQRAASSSGKGALYYLSLTITADKKGAKTRGLAGVVSPFLLHFCWPFTCFTSRQRIRGKSFFVAVFRFGS
jgi:hypothetical protein